MASDNHRNLARQKSVASPLELTVKYSLFFINVVVWIIGAVLLIAGIYAKAKKDLNSVDGTLPWYMDPANLFIIFGSVVFMFTFVGCIGALRENRILLDIYTYVLIFIMFVEVTFVVYVTIDRSRVKDSLETLLLKTVPKYRDDADLQSIIDYVQEKVSCCGVKSYNDWDDNVYFNCSSPGVEACGVPYSCCKSISSSLNTQCGYGTRLSTASAANVTAAIYTGGCVDATIELFFSGTNLALIVTVAVIAFLMQTMSCVLAIAMRRRVSAALAKWSNHPNEARYGGRR